MIEKICSGGQTGADLGGLLAAEAAGVPTYGHMPPGCQTESGPQPGYLQRFGMLEAPYGGYVLRTELNVRDSDGTMRFYTDPRSAGERATLRAIRSYDKPYFDINLNRPQDIESARRWLSANNIRALNVAGHRESRCPGIQKFAQSYVAEILRQEAVLGQFDTSSEV